MNKSSIELSINDGLKLFGILDVSTVNELWMKSLSVFSSPVESIQIDLKGIMQSDSAGVALLIAWVRLARKQNKNLCFNNLPKQMRAIIKMSDLEKILPIGK